MLGQFEEKGKIYTPVISKEPIYVLIITTAFHIQGKVYVRHGERLKDQIDLNERYLAVTDATVCDLTEKMLFTVNFLAVNHTNIICIAPMEEIIHPEESSHE